MRLDTLLAQVRQVLAEAGITDPASEARKLTLETLMIEPSSWLADPGQAVSETNCETVLERVRRRAEGRPLYRLLGWREFHGLRLMLSSETLEPRDDTEALVDLCLSTCRTGARSDDAFHIVDLGTGTGAIALALLAEMPAARALGVDLSADALRTAERNADRNGLGERFSTRQSRWFESVEGCFDLIVSNPPYIESAVIAGLEGAVRDHDPHLALDGGADGLDAYRAIAAGAGRHLRPGGRVGVEIGLGQEAAVERIFGASGFRCLETRRDISGILRAMLFETGG